MTPPAWTCDACRRPMRGHAPTPPRCLPCALRAVTERAPEPRRPETASRSGVLAARGWPEDLLSPFEGPGEWPRHPATDHAGKAAVDLAEWRGRRWASLLLTGAVGTGKSYLATELAWRFWLDGREVGFATGEGLVARVFGGDRDAMDRARGLDLLVLDDVDRGVSAKGFGEVVQPVLLDRLAHRRPVIVTTNAALFRGRRTLYHRSAAVADRLRDGLVVLFRGSSRRGDR